MEAVVTLWKLGDDLRRVKGEPSLTIAGRDGQGEKGVHLATEVEGLVDSPVDAFTKTPGGRPGARLVSTRFTERTLVFRVTVMEDPDAGLSWEQADALWRSYWDYDRYTGVQVVTEDADRTLFARLAEIEVDTTYDPHVGQVADVLMTVVADDPFWYPSEESKLYKATHTFRGPLEIMEGDIPEFSKRFSVFPTLIVETAGGPVADGRLEITADGVQAGALPLVDMMQGNTYWFRTDPGARQVAATTGDRNVWARMNGVRFNPNIPRDFKTLKVEYTGDTWDNKYWVRADIPFLRPWG